MSKIKDFLLKIKSEFDFAFPPAPHAPSPSPAPSPAPAAKTMKLKDGTEIMVHQAGESLEAGDMVMVNGAAAAAGTYTLEDGSVITCDASGMIVSVTPPVPITAAAPPAPPAQAPAPSPVVTPSFSPAAFSLPNTMEELNKMFASFATGTIEERIANLEVVSKALMESSFGWKIREAEQKLTEETAINVYRDSLKTVSTQMEAQTNTIRGLFTILEEISKESTAEPVTLPEGRRQKFETLLQKKESRLEKMAKARQEFQKELQ